MTKIFISYRWEDSKHAAGRLSLALSTYVRPDDIYLDVEGPRGVDFIQLYESRAAEADVVLAVIGPDWNSERRLGNPDNHVRREIVAADAGGVPVFPVLLDEARLPKKEDLPDVLQFLCSINGDRLAHETFDGDAARIWRTVRELDAAKSQVPVLTNALRLQLDEEVEHTKQIHRRRNVEKLPHSTLLVAVDAVRAELMAIESRYRARSAASSASIAARRGKQKEIGFYDYQTVQADGTNVRSAGEGEANNKNGYCEYEYSTTDGRKSEYRGQFKNNRQSGFGVRTETRPDASRTVFEGAVLDGQRNGLGVSEQSGHYWVGEFRDVLHGAGVYRWPNGDRFEGEFLAGEFHGLGVIWSPEGTIKKEGRWVRGEHQTL